MIVPPLPPESVVVSLDDYRIKKSATPCLHRQKSIDAPARIVTCSACNAVLDAFDALLELARNHERIKEQREHLDNEIKRRRASIEELRTEEKRVKARVRQWREKET